ncbi:hypothetical protein TNCV_3576881 [Trichonephila clavipes]|uniref:Uncharacterized protein n=1 Tax=Trichonephila clavipes TaxID=2585209 RepID=A0A8X6UXV5_TRICX|nr:hypothetical protein TNCV_3576881 [Trichonephila clavipes]
MIESTTDNNEFLSKDGTKLDSVKSTPAARGWWQKKTSDRANCKGQLALTARGESRLRRIVRSQRSQILSLIPTQLD